MTPQLWKEVKRVFAEALEVPENEREPFLNRTCGGKPDLFREVCALLEAHQDADSLDRLQQEWLSPLKARLMDGLPPGTYVGPYEVVREIGRGGMGQVYLARDNRLKRPVALKVLLPSMLSNEEARRRFLREARAVSALDHPNVCTIYEVGQYGDSRLYLAMAYYEGETLKERLNRGIVSPGESVEIIRYVASGLKAAHRAGIIHRDIKPANIMITKDGQVKILDFGIARVRESSQITRTGAQLGTTAYLPPEQVEGKGVSERSDQWSLGVLWYEMVTGKRPFHGETDSSILYRIMHDQPVPPHRINTDLPLALSRVILRMLSKAPASRYPDLLEALEAAWTALSPDRASRIPTFLTSFIGREQEMDEIVRLMERVRLVTVTGPGGIGKTRLAREIAFRLEGEYRDGLHFVSLASVQDPDLVARALAYALSMVESSASSSLDDLITYLSDREILLILDNFEQITAAASVVHELLLHCPGVKMLVTSRQPLSISAEYEFSLPALNVPQETASVDDPTVLLQSTAVRLFVDRAQSVKADFALTQDNAEDVAALCRRLDGLPLALELAAARVKLFTPAMLRNRLVDRLDLLKGSAHDRPARQQTLEQAIAWSYELLDAPLQRLFRQVSVFRSGFDLDMAEFVLREEDASLDVLEAVSVLLDHSLLQTRERRGTTRIYMLETIRTFAWQRLRDSGESDTVRARHAACVAGLADRLEVDLTGPGATVAMDRLAVEHDNIDAALGYAKLMKDAVLGLRISGAIWRYWLARGYLQEGLDQIQHFCEIAGDDEPTALRARAMNGAGTLAHNLGENESARDYLQESLQIWRRLNDQQGIATVLNNLSWVACELSDLPTAASLSEEALALCERLGDRRGRALALNNLAWIAMYRGDPDRARMLHAESLTAREHIGDRFGQIFAIANLAHVEAMGGDVSGALARISSVLEQSRASINKTNIGWTLTAYGWILNENASYTEALVALEESLDIWKAHVHLSGVAWSMTGLAHAHARLGHLKESAALLQEAVEYWKQVNTPWGLAWAEYETGWVAEAEGRIRDAAVHYERALSIQTRMGDQRGRALSERGLERCR